MRRTLALLLFLPLFGLAPDRDARARPAGQPVVLDVSVAGGARLGRLIGGREARVTYFALEDVARLAGGTVRRWTGGARATLVARRGIVELRRDSPVVSVDGQPVTLGGAVRVRQGVWQVPGDLLVRVLPTLVGTGLELRPPGSLPAASGRPPVVPAALRRPAPADARPAGPPRVVGAEAPPPATGSPEEPGGDLTAGGLEVRVRSYPRFTRVVLESAEELAPRLVERGEDLLVTLPGLGSRRAAGTRTVRDGLVAGVELTETGGQPALRVRFERAPAGRKVYRLVEPPRVVLEFQREAPRPSAPPRGPSAAPAPLRTIAIDAGHGGHDTGAVGPRGLLEKELTLDIAQRVSALLQEELGVRVVLTRARDEFVGLRERTALANRARAELFVSIHANAAPAAAATGTETYFLSTEASDGAARQAAARENRVIALEGASRNGGSRDVLRTILWDLAQAEFQQESSRLAEGLQAQLDRALRRPSRGVKQAPFYVLGGAAMPAVLLEVGFITNPQDEQRLRDDGYRDRIARAIAAGLAAYKRGYEARTGVVVRQ